MPLRKTPPPRRARIVKFVMCSPRGPLAKRLRNEVRRNKRAGAARTPICARLNNAAEIPGTARPTIKARARALTPPELGRGVGVLLRERELEAVRERPRRADAAPTAPPVRAGAAVARVNDLCAGDEKNDDIFMTKTYKEKQPPKLSGQNLLKTFYSISVLCIYKAKK